MQSIVKVNRLNSTGTSRTHEEFLETRAMSMHIDLKPQNHGDADISND